MKSLDARYWQSLYNEGDTPWDIGGISPAILDYMEKLPTLSLRILIPGAGKGHEAAWLLAHGFHEVFVCDWAAGAIDQLRIKAPDFPPDQLLVQDFFSIEGYFDLILEQTFFCALDPGLRTAYAAKCADLLQPVGKIAGLLFASHFEKPGPPFGGTKSEYLKLFEPKFNIIQMELSTKSIPPRLGNELFFEAMVKKN